MKTEQEIIEIANKLTPILDSTQNSSLQISARIGFKEGYTQAQTDMQAELAAKLYYADIIKQHIEFTSSTFPKSTANGALIHMQREIAEVMEETDPCKLAIEYADCLGCLLDSANRSGITPDKLFKSFQDKIEINKYRQWKYNGDGSYSHIK